MNRVQISPRIRELNTFILELEGEIDNVRNCRGIYCITLAGKGDERDERISGYKENIRQYRQELASLTRG